MPNGLANFSITEIKGRLVYVHPAWYAFIKVCQNIRFGEIEQLKIQDGLPMPAEEVTKKIRFFEDQS